MNWSDPEHDVAADLREAAQPPTHDVPGAADLRFVRWYGAGVSDKTREHIEGHILGKASVNKPRIVTGDFAFRIPVRGGKDRSLRGKARRKARRA